MKYKPRYKGIIEEMKGRGCSDKEVCKKLGIAVSTLRSWIARYDISVSRKPGRPLLECTAEVIDKARQLSLLGLTKEQIDVALGVSIDTRLRWEKESKTFSEAINNDLADAKVANSLWNRANGSVVWEERINSDGEIVKVYKQLPPSESASIFWLKNRRSKFWADKREHEINEGLLRKVLSGDPVDQDKWEAEHCETEE